MVGVLQPLGQQFPITNSDGTPTNYFIRWAQQRQQDIGTAVSLDQVTALIDEISIKGTLPIQVTGTIASGLTISLANTTVTPGTYGDATHVGQFTVDQKGRLTAAVNVPVSGGGGGGGFSPPTIVQQSYTHISGSQNVSLASTPTPGNTLVIISTGAGDTNQGNVPNPPAGWMVEAWMNNGPNAGPPGSGPSFQSAMVFSRSVLTGDGTTYNFNSPNGSNILFYEFAGRVAIDVSGIMALSVVSSKLQHSPGASPVSGGMRIACIECDGGNTMTFDDPTITTIAQASSSVGHYGIFGHLPAGFNNTISLGYSSGPSYSMGMTVNIGTA